MLLTSTITLWTEFLVGTGVAFVMITHDDRLAEAADRILLIEDGEVFEISKEEHRRRIAGIV